MTKPLTRNARPAPPTEGVVQWVARIAGDLIDFANCHTGSRTDEDWRAAFAAWKREVKRCSP